MKKLFDSAIFLTVSTAVLYCISTAYYHGYLISWGLNSDLLDRSLHQVLYQGFLESLVPVYMPLFIYTLGVFLFSYIIFPSWINILKKSIKSKRKFLRLKRRFFGKKEGSQYEKKMKKYSKNMGILLLIVTVFLLYLVYVESLGKERAQEIKNSIVHKEYSENDLIILKGSNAKQIFLLACGARNCAGIDLETKMIYYFEPQKLSFKSVKI